MRRRDEAGQYGSIRRSSAAEAELAVEIAAPAVQSERGSRAKAVKASRDDSREGKRPSTEYDGWGGAVFQIQPVAELTMHVKPPAISGASGERESVVGASRKGSCAGQSSDLRGHETCGNAAVAKFALSIVAPAPHCFVAPAKG